MSGGQWKWSRETDREFQELPKWRREKLKRMATRLMSKAIRGASDSDPRDQASIAKSAIELLDKMEASEVKALQKQEIAARLIGGVAGSRSAPDGCPPHVQAVWAEYMAGDATARKVVDEWIRAELGSSSGSGEGAKE